MVHKICCQIIAVASSLLPLCAVADDVPQIERHVVRESGVPIDSNAGGAGGSQSVISFASGEASVDISSGGEFDGLPRCAKPEIRKEEIYGILPGDGMFDILFYDPNDSLQRERRTRFSGRTAPYIESAMSYPYAQPSVIQAFARTIGLRCLPTHIGIANESGHAFIQYREGEAAWSDGK